MFRSGPPVTNLQNTSLPNVTTFAPRPMIPQCIPPHAKAAGNLQCPPAYVVPGITAFPEQPTQSASTPRRLSRTDSPESDLDNQPHSDLSRPRPLDRSIVRPARTRQNPFERPQAGPSRAPVCESMRGLALAMSERLIQLMAESRSSEAMLYCLRCGGIPQVPVTGPCGHTSCRSCVAELERCACGEEVPWTATNILVQQLINRLPPKETFLKFVVAVAGVMETEDQGTAAASDIQQISAPNSPSAVKLNCLNGRHHHIPGEPIPKICTLLASPDDEHSGNEKRYRHGLDLAFFGSRVQAVPHLVKAAAFGSPVLAKYAKQALVMVLQKLYTDHEISRLTLPLPGNKLSEYSAEWVTSGDLDCLLCCHVFRNPVTTPCGHTYCRPCIERSMDYRKTCPLCSTSLEEFNVASTADTTFLVHAIEATDRSATEAPDRDNRLPIFVCTVAYPTVSCPLHVFEPRYRLMIRRCMRSGTRRFGMVNKNKDNSYADYGTVLEIRDCVLLPDGRSILSTVGVSRFQVLSRDTRDGYDVADVITITDYKSKPTLNGRFTAYDHYKLTRRKAELWLLTMDADARAKFEASFGPLPPIHQDDYYGPDGPAWVWWVLAILPLRNEIKVMILSALNASKRLFAIEHTFDVMDFRAETTPAAKDPFLPAPLLL